ncbi:hypothetical protein Micbo1qcDRAFT_232569 [Microdochium bolleyi]|uniref:FAD-binding domain-containing protein n=1 Tax=Microdochium bolleyi TaxID=196109 RepID=A0A136J6U7_9PEZI|nr:hypothetical protein Micbo1qcDRAFT_232569 [Microdochium bolleyi]
MAAHAKAPFRVIVAGGGLVGLTAAHVLHKAGIDFVILEKHKTVLPAVGSVMTIWPQTFRILEQLGLNDTIAPMIEALRTNTVMVANDAKELDVSNFPDMVEKKCEKQVADLAEKYLRPYLSTYRVLVAQTESLPNVPTNIKCDGVGYGVTTQFMYGEKISVFALYEKLDNPTSEHHKYTDKDKADMLERWGDLMVVPGYTVRDVRARCRSPIGLYNCEEGLVERWHHGRIVLVGDAVRKLDPHTGQGYNEGVTDMVVLANGLRQMLLDHGQAGSLPGTAAVEAVSAAYKAKRMKQMGVVTETAKAFARMAAWLSWKDMVLAKYVQPYLPLNWLSLNYVLGPLIQGSPVLEWLEELRQPPAKMAWKHHPKVAKAVDQEGSSGRSATAVSKVSVAKKWTLVAGASAAAAAAGHRLRGR